MASDAGAPPLTDPYRSADENSSRRMKLGLQMDIRSRNCIRRWKDQSRHQIYSTKLYEALQNVRMGCAPSCRRVKETACRLLAASARGRSRWSRAILARKSRSELDFRHRKVIRKALSVHKNFRMKNLNKKRKKKMKTGLHPLQKRIGLLGQMIPGCGKLPLPNLLEEAADYIAALEMQLRVMAELTQALDGSGNPHHVSREQAGWSDM